MTREEAMAVLKKEASIIDNDSIEMTAKEWDEFDELKRDAIPVAIEALSIEVEQTDCTDFIHWLLEEVMDEDNWELNAVANGEIICRKLKKLGLLEVKDGYYVRTLSIDVDCSTCKHKDKGWDSKECDSCCGNNNHYKSADVV